MAKSQDGLCIYTTLHGPQLRYAENLCRIGESDGPFCFRSKQRWRFAADYLESHTSMPILIRDIEDSGPPFAVTYSADLTQVWLDEHFESPKAHREWLEEWLWVQREFYEETGLTSKQFHRREVLPALNAKTNFLVTKLRRVKRVPISRLTKSDGESLSPDYKRGYAICKMPKPGSVLFKKLTTAIPVAEKPLSKRELDALDKKYAGTPEYVLRVVNAIRRPSAIRLAILKRDGTTCRLCGCEGFQKKNGGRYAETHHMIELNKQAPHTLQSWNVIVVCPTCHKMLHYGETETTMLENGWVVVVNGETHVLQ